MSGGNIDVFTKNMKQIAYEFDGTEIAEDLFPVLEDLFPLADAAVSASSNSFLLRRIFKCSLYLLLRFYRIGFGVLVELGFSYPMKITFAS